MYLPCGGFSHGESEYLKKMEQDHDDFAERIRKTLYYGQLPGTDRPSLPLTDLAVRYYQDASPRELGKLDHYWAASTARAACMTPTSVVAGMMYVKRLKRRREEYLSQISSSDLFLISVMMASKFLYDEGVDEEVFNDEWATSGNLDTEDVNELEREFLSAIDWQLFVRPDEFQEVLNRIEKRIALEQGLDRGWFSYTDLELLTRDFSLLNLCDQQMRELAKVFGISTLAYVAGILTMVGSTIMGTTTSSALVHFGSTALPQISSLVPTTMVPSLLLQVTPESGVTVSEDLLSNLGQSIPTLDEFEMKNYCNKTLGVISIQEKQAKVIEDSEDDSDKISQVDQTKDISNDNVKNKENTPFISSFLSPFLVLITLKDTITKFSQTLMEYEPSNIDKNMELESDEICSDGPCLPDSWKNCWNFSSEHDWTAFKSEQARKSNVNGHTNKNTGKNTVMTKNRALKMGVVTDNRWQNIYATICCCKDVYKGMLVKLGLSDQFMDSFKNGFTTSAYPIFIT